MGETLRPSKAIRSGENAAACSSSLSLIDFGVVGVRAALLGEGGVGGVNDVRVSDDADAHTKLPLSPPPPPAGIIHLSIAMRLIIHLFSYAARVGFTGLRRKNAAVGGTKNIFRPKFRPFFGRFSVWRFSVLTRKGKIIQPKIFRPKSCKNAV